MNLWEEQCKKAVEGWKRSNEETDEESWLAFSPTEFEDALFIKEYMGKYYPWVNIFIVVKGFMYRSDMKGLGD